VRERERERERENNCQGLFFLSINVCIIISAAIATKLVCKIYLFSTPPQKQQQQLHHHMEKKREIGSKGGACCGYLSVCTRNSILPINSTTALLRRAHLIETEATLRDHGNCM